MAKCSLSLSLSLDRAARVSSNTKCDEQTAEDFARGRHLPLPLPVTCQSCLNSCRSWRRSRSPIHLFVPHTMATPAAAVGSYTLVKGERESLEMDFRCLFDFLQIPLLRKHKVGEGPRKKGLDFVHPSRKKRAAALEARSATSSHLPLPIPNSTTYSTTSLRK